MPRKSTPETEFIEATYTIRKMRLPPEVKLTKQSLLRWLALSLGLLSEDETRQSVIPVMDAAFTLQLRDRTEFELEDVILFLKKQEKEMPKKTVSYHLKKLQETGLLEKTGRRYRFVKDAYSSHLSLPSTFQETYTKNIQESTARVAKAFEEIHRIYEGSE
jgi:DNA-binding transcriptional ArsR family regulator